MPTSPLPAVFLHHLRSLLAHGQPAYAALPEAARTCGYDWFAVLSDWVALGRDARLSTLLEPRISRHALVVLREAEERGDVLGGLKAAAMHQSGDPDGLAHHSW